MGNSASAEKQDSNATGRFPLELLPQKLLSDIFRMLPILDFLRMQRVNQRFRDICLANPPTTASLDYRVFAIHPSGQEFRHEIDFKSFMNEFMGKYGTHITKFEISAPPDCKSYVSRVDFEKTIPRGMDQNEYYELVGCNTLTSLSLRHVDIGIFDLKAIGTSFPNLNDLELCSWFDFHGLADFPRLKRLHSSLWIGNYLNMDDEFSAAKIIFFKMEKVAELGTSLPMLCKLFESFEDHEVPAVKAISFHTVIRIHEESDLMKYLIKFPCVTSVDSGPAYNIEQCCLFFEHFAATVTTLCLSECNSFFQLIPSIEAVRRFENLERLEITGSNFPDDDDCSFLSAFPRLKVLRFVATIKYSDRNTKQITSFPAQALIDHLPAGANLSEADFEDTGVVLNEIAKNLVRRNMLLRKLRLFNLPASPVPDRGWCGNCSKPVTAGEVAAKTISHWKALKVNNLKQLINLSGGVLESLVLVGHLNIKDSFLEFLSASGVDRLEFLDLSKCAVTDGGVDRFLIDRRAKIEAGIVLPFLHFLCSLESMNKSRLDMANGANVIFDETIDPDGVFEETRVRRPFS